MKYLAPVGTADERATGQFPPGKWIIALGYGDHYERGIHPGVDLNLNSPRWDEDAHKPVYAIADGVVTCAQEFPVWGKIVVIRHGTIYARYAHVEQMRVGVGQTVAQGEQIAQVGNADGTQPYHLHFDISPTDILSWKPSHWPKFIQHEVDDYYVDPVVFYRKQEVPEKPSMGLTFKIYKNVHGTVNVRRLPTTDSKVGPVVANIAINQTVGVVEQVPRVQSDGYEWGELTTGYWTALKPVDGKEWFIPFP
jgi:murein DD-endopeptidase MepM/ murein hydrolase activator NlpD